VFIYPIVKAQLKVFWGGLTPGERQSDIFVADRLAGKKGFLTQASLGGIGSPKLPAPRQIQKNFSSENRRRYIQKALPPGLEQGHGAGGGGV
jgi:hypothetical protein